MGEALIIMAKNPVMGKVKTRIAKDLGDEAALNIYIQLLQHTCDICSTSKADKFVFYSDFIPEEDIWDPKVFSKFLQSGNDLGQRMYKAFATILEKGYTKVVMIGTDCRDLESAHLDLAFQALNQVDVSYGPAEDGGYYLIGMKELHHYLFENMPWSTEQVLPVSIARTEKLKRSYFLLPTLKDIDNAEDWNA